MKTAEKYEEMGFTKLGKGKVQDRHGGIYYPKKAKTAQKAIKLFCFECMGMDRRYKNPPKPYDDVAKCTDPMCPLFDFRVGKNPFLGKPLTDEQRKAAVERLALARNRRSPVEQIHQISTVRA